MADTFIIIVGVIYLVILSSLLHITDNKFSRVCYTIAVILQSSLLTMLILDYINKP